MGLSLAVLVCLAFVIGCTPSPPEPLRIATNVWPGYEPLYLARSLGLYPPRSVRLVEMANSTDTLRAFRNGLVDCAALTLDETLTLAQDNADLRVILVTDVSHGADAVLARPGLRSLADLRGKRIGVEHTAVGGYLLARTLDAAHLRPRDVEVVPVTESGHEQAFVSGSVDAIVTFEPTRTRLLRHGARVLFDSARIPGEIVDVLVARTETTRTRAGDLEMLCAAWFSALDHLATHGEDAAHRMAGREGLSGPEFGAALSGLRFPDRASNRRLLNGELVKPAQRLVEVMKHEKLLRKAPDPGLLFEAPAPEASSP